MFTRRFYRVAGLSPFWLVDVCVQQHGRETILAPHDPFKLLFDRSGVVQTTKVTVELEKLHTVVTLADLPAALGRADALFQTTLAELKYRNLK